MLVKTEYGGLHWAIKPISGHIFFRISPGESHRGAVIIAIQRCKSRLPKLISLDHLDLSFARVEASIYIPSLSIATSSQLHISQWYALSIPTHSF